MKSWIAMALALGFAMLLSGCNTTGSLSIEDQERIQREELELKRSYLARLQSVEESCYEVMEALGPIVAEYNEKEAYGFSGAVFVTKRFYPVEVEEAALERGFDDFPTVRRVVEGSPADLGGLMIGDRLLEINGRKVPKGEGAVSFIEEKLKSEWNLEESNLLKVERNGAEHFLEVGASKAAYYNVVVTPFLKEPAYAEGKTLYFSLQAMETLEEEELDYVCAFALVQNVMRHSRMKGTNELIGGVLDFAAAMYGVHTGGLFGNLGRNAHKAGFLIESDILALYALADAGVDVSGYPDFWESNLNGSDKGMDRASRERVDAMRQAVAEIAAKKASGQPVFPSEYLSGKWELKKALDA